MTLLGGPVQKLGGTYGTVSIAVNDNMIQCFLSCKLHNLYNEMGRSSKPLLYCHWRGWQLSTVILIAEYEILFVHRNDTCITRGTVIKTPSPFLLGWDVGGWVIVDMPISCHPSIPCWTHIIQTNEWMNEWMIEWMNEWVNKWKMNE